MHLFGTAFFFFHFTVLLPRDIPVPDITLPTSPAEIERGPYLANHNIILGVEPIYSFDSTPFFKRIC